MHSPAEAETEADACVEELREALAAHGITLPSLGIDLPAFASRCPYPAAGRARQLQSPDRAGLGHRPARGRGVMRPAVTLELLATPAGVSAVRRALRPHGSDVQLCASELVTNVIRHVGEGVSVTVRVWREEGGRVRLAVTDPDPRALPVLVGAVDAEDESGRGLALLDALAVRWGVEREASRKTVWCELLDCVPETPERSGRRNPSAGALGHSSARS